MSYFKDETKNRYDRWTVLARAKNRGTRAYWLCRCACGTEREVCGKDLRNGDSQSCGCLRKERASSIETRKKISKATKGKKNPSFGKFGKDSFGFKHGFSRTKEYMCMHAEKHRALKAGAEGTHTIEDLKYIYDHQKGICGKCRKYIPFNKMTVDHIVPLTWGGSNYPSNIQLLCKSCNCSKGNHNDIDYRDYVPLFLN